MRGISLWLLISREIQRTQMTVENRRAQRPSRGPWMWKKATAVATVVGACKVRFDVVGTRSD